MATATSCTPSLTIGSRAVSVKTGLTDNGRIEVTAGLSEETPVVATIKTAPAPGTLVQSTMVRDKNT